jgi:hypothetical protein
MSALSYPELIKLVGFYNIVEVESYRENVARICLVKSRINKNNYYILHTKNPENGGWGFISKHFELTSEFTRELEEELR